MTRKHFTEPFRHDGRLKVLWLDDKWLTGEILEPEDADRLPESLRYTPWFAITSVTDLVDLQSLKQDPAPPNATHEYYREGAPFDVYILDFRLCDGKEDCELERHKVEGLHIPAVGLLSGMLTALNWPTHPQAIIPYSGHPEEFGDVWKLCSQFRTENVHLANAVEAKGKRDYTDLLHVKVARAYRDTLAAAFASDTAAIPEGEWSRWGEMLLEAGDWIAADEEIELHVAAYGLRTFKIGALFFDVKERRDGATVVPTEAVVRELLDVAKKHDPIVRRARQLSSLFWQLRRSERSHLMYKAIVRGRPVLQDPSVPWIGAPMWRTGRGRADREPTLILRLAILMLLVQEHALRVRVQQFVMGRELTAMLTFLDQVNNGDEELHYLLKLCASSKRAFETVLDVERLQAEVDRAGFTSAVDLLKLQLPLTSLDLVQLLDPMPEPRAADAEPGHAYWKSSSEGTRVGTGLNAQLNGRLVGDTTKTIDIIKLLQGDAATTRRMLLAQEWTEVVRFAGTCMTPQDMPAWLSDASCN